MKTFLNHIFTSADNETFSMSKVIAFAAGMAMVYNFIKQDVTDIQGFGTAIALVIASLAAKTFTDVK